MSKSEKEVTTEQRQALLEALKARFEKHPHRHAGLSWDKIRTRLDARPEKMAALQRMEASGGEPDVVGLDKKTGEFRFYDCSPQSPGGRRSLCYDREALDARKEHKPKNSAMDAAAAMGVQILTEEQYRELQTLDEFDTTTSSWVQSPPDIRKRGGAIFCDRRYGHVFTYHNGADSYYAARGFRSILKV